MLQRGPIVLFLALALSCAHPPPPTAAPAAPPPPPPGPLEQLVQGTVRVTATSLNVRKDASTEAEIIGQVKKGAALSVLANGDSWTMVQLQNGEVGWVASRFVEREGAKSTAKKRRGSCPADSDYAFVETPTPRFAESGAHGLVVIEANVNAKGSVTSTKIVSNGTGDEALAFLAEREIKQSKFAAPIRNCVPKGFVFTYRRTF